MRRIALSILTAAAVSLTLLNPVEAGAAPAGTVPLTLKFTSLSFDVWGRVTAAGEIPVLPASPEAPEAPPKLTKPMALEFSNGTSPWTKVGTAKVRQTDGFPEFWTPRFDWGRSGYWRWHYAGDDTYAETFSPVRKVHRWNTHFTNFKLSKKTARTKTKIVLSGRLYRWTKSKKIGFAKRNVQLGFDCKNDGSNAWYSDFGWTKTDSKGRFKKTVKAFCTGKVFAVYWGAKGLYASETKSLALKVPNTPKGFRVAASTSPFLPHRSSQGVDPTGTR